MANVYFGLLTQFKLLWEKEYPGQKFYPQKYHYKQLKERMASAEGFEPIPPEEVVKRMRVYLRTDYWKICKHNFSKFVEYFDVFVPPREPEQPRRPTQSVVYCAKCNYRHYEGMPCKCNVRSTEPAPIPMVHDIIEQIKKENRAGLGSQSEQSAICAESAPSEKSK
jgi:hypothetical protein